MVNIQLKLKEGIVIANLINVNDPLNNNIARVNALAVELDEILSVNEMNLQKNEDLLNRIAICESRQEYVRDALAESERMAREIIKNAELRVAKIMSNAQRVIIPQQESIARLDKEISVLTEHIRSKSMRAPVAKSQLFDMPTNKRDFYLREFQYLELGEDKPQEVQAIISETDIEAKQETFLREQQERDMGEIAEVSQAEHSQDNVEPIADRKFSWRDPQEQFERENEENKPLVYDQYNTKPALEREFSLREPREPDMAQFTAVIQSDPDQADEDIVRPVSVREFSMRMPQEQDLGEAREISQPEPDQDDRDLLVQREFSLRIPQNLSIPGDSLSAQNETVSAQPQKINNSGYTMPEPNAEEISNYNLAMSLMEQNETDMHLDVFVDIRYIAATGEKTGQMQRHSWQVKILVEVPVDSQRFVGYGKVSAAVTSTLLRFDDVVLNDVYPFGIISSSPENIAMYFFNCLQDTVSLLDLRLKEISIWENQALVMEVNQRNMEIDDQLQKGDDILHDIRSLLAARDRTDDRTNSRGRFGHLFKNI